MPDKLIIGKTHLYAKASHRPLHVTIRIAIGNFLMVVLWNQAFTSNRFRDIRLQSARPLWCKSSLRMRDITWPVPLCKIGVHILIFTLTLLMPIHFYWAQVKTKE